MNGFELRNMKKCLYMHLWIFNLERCKKKFLIHIYWLWNKLTFICVYVFEFRNTKKYLFYAFILFEFRNMIKVSFYTYLRIFNLEIWRKASFYIHSSIFNLEIWKKCLFIHILCTFNSEIRKKSSFTRIYAFLIQKYAESLFS